MERMPHLNKIGYAAAGLMSIGGGLCYFDIIGSYLTSSESEIIPEPYKAIGRIGFVLFVASTLLAGKIPR